MKPSSSLPPLEVPIGATAALDLGGETPVKPPETPNSPAVNLAAPILPRIRGPVLLGCAALLCFCGGIAAWSVFAPLSEAAIADGVVEVEGHHRTIQHLEGGIVTEVLVHEGERVASGQLLMRLSDIDIASARGALQAQYLALLAQDGRASSEIAHAARIAFPAPLLAEGNEPKAIEAMAAQTALFLARQAARQSAAAVVEARILQQQAEITSARSAAAAGRLQLESLRQEEQSISPLVAQGLIQRPRLLQLQRSATEQEQRVAQAEASVSRANAAIAEQRQQLRQAEDEQLQETAGELAELRLKLQEIAERLRHANDERQRRDIRAPEAGRVMNLHFATLGAVVRPGEVLMELVPQADPLVAEVHVRPLDIDQVRPGLPVTVRLPAYKSRVVPSLAGIVASVAPDVTQDERSGRSYYRTRIQIDRLALQAVPGVELVPGMPVEAQIQTGTRSLFRYLTQPLRDSFGRAFREP